MASLLIHEGWLIGVWGRVVNMVKVASLNDITII